jgi:hypothetical protein
VFFAKKGGGGGNAPFARLRGLKAIHLLPNQNPGFSDPSRLATSGREGKKDLISSFDNLLSFPAALRSAFDALILGPLRGTCSTRWSVKMFYSHESK